MLTRMRYVTRRLSRQGKERWYWQRPGHKLVRLPDDPAARFAEQERLNRIADGASPEPVKGTIRWVIDTYRASDGYRDLAPGTVKYYKRFLAAIEKLGPYEPFAAFGRAEIVDFLMAYPKAHQRRQCAAVIKNLVGVARYYGMIDHDPATNLRLKTTTPRDRVWSDAEIQNWLRQAAEEDSHMTTAFLLLQYTAQRPSDVLAMTWGQYDGHSIRLRQQKTGAFVGVPCHPALKTHLDAMTKTRGDLMIVSYRGRQVPYLRFNERFRRVCAAADVTAQARDLRRTAMVRMAEAGATVPQIAAVSGHSVDHTQRILETYLPRNMAMAEAAIALLAGHKRGKESNPVRENGQKK